MEQDKYQQHHVESAADTLMRADEHRADPKMMELVQEHLKKKKHAINKITSIKQLKEAGDKKAKESAADIAEDKKDKGRDEAIEAS